MEADCAYQRVGALSWGNKQEDGWKTAKAEPTENTAAQVRTGRLDPVVYSKVLRDGVAVMGKGQRGGGGLAGK